jgi:transcriptional regulator with XRE-family HTH domain
MDDLPANPSGSTAAPRPLDLRHVGVLLRNERRKRSITQADLAKASGVSKSRIEAIESGRCRDAGFGLVSAILASLGLGLHVVGQIEEKFD